MRGERGGGLVRGGERPEQLNNVYMPTAAGGCKVTKMLPLKMRQRRAGAEQTSRFSRFNCKAVRL